MAIPLIMFLAGAFGTLSQVILLREMLVVFHGNELTIGAVMGSWLAGIGMGALAARALLARLNGEGALRGAMAAAAAAGAVLLPFQMLATRAMRPALGLAIGEYPSLASTVLPALLVSLPTSAAVGFFFPAACALARRGAGEDGVAAAASSGIAYVWESAGSMIAGAAAGMFLFHVMSSFRVAAVACAAAAAAAFLLAARNARFAAAAAAVALLLAALTDRPVAALERYGAVVRWRSFGVLPAEDGDARPEDRIVAVADSVYQNLALIRTGDAQYTLYGDGRVHSTFPDTVDAEFRIHFVMAQNPEAKKVLMLGGNPCADVAELLKYPVEKLVRVELDPAVGEILESHRNLRGCDAPRDARVQTVYADGAAFVAGCRERFDAVLVMAPEPVTAAANRFYTLEFYRAARRVLADGGFICTSVAVSERLQREAADFGGSIFRTLREVFPKVLVTAGDTARFFAGDEAANLSFDRDELYRRSLSAGIGGSYFRPEYFLQADEIEREKVRMTVAKFSAADSALNTELRPAAYLYNLLLWTRVTGGGARLLARAPAAARPGPIAGALAGVGIACLVAGGLMGAAGRRPVAAGWSRAMLLAALASTGFFGMAMEISLTCLYQSRYGCVYSEMGLIVASFMAGLVLGGAVGRAAGMARRRRASAAAMVLEALMVFFPLGVAAAIRLTGLGGNALPPWGGKGMIFLCTAFAGWLTGAEFPLVNRLFCDAGGRAVAAASAADAADHFGAAAGGLAVGALLLPAAGMGAALVVLAAAKACGLLCLLSAFAASAGGGKRR